MKECTIKVRIQATGLEESVHYRKQCNIKTKSVIKTNFCLKKPNIEEINKQPILPRHGVFFSPPTVPSANNFLMMLKLQQSYTR